MRINKFKFRHYYRFTRPIGENVDSNKREFAPVSDSGFEINEHGYIRNSISTLLRTQNTLSFERALANFVELNGKSPFKDLTAEEQFEQLRPRWCQLPSQKLQFEQWLLDKRISSFEELKQQQEEEKRKEEEKAAPAPAPAPASAPAAE